MADGVSTIGTSPTEDSYAKAAKASFCAKVFTGISSSTTPRCIADGKTQDKNPICNPLTQQENTLSLILYTYPKNFRAYKALVAAQFSGTNVEIDSDFVFGETNKSDNFMTKFPLGKVPVFSSKTGLHLFESNAIAKYVGNEQLSGSTPAEAALVQQWIDFGDNEILPSACTWVFPCLGITQFHKQDTERAKQQINKALSVLNNHLLTRTYLVGEVITQADISVTCNFIILFEHVLDPEFRKPFLNVTRWFTTMVNQPQFKSVVGDIVLASKMAVSDGKRYTELHASEKKKEKASKQEQKKQMAKPKPQEQMFDDDDDSDGDRLKEEAKDPYLAFPKGTFDMDAWKRVYSNNDTATIALPYFWENFDKEHYSAWYCDYAEDLSDQMTFQTCNLVSGMFQRLDKMRKQAFASMCIFGSDKTHTVSGVWIWRSHQLAFTLSDDWGVDYESYKWTKLNVDDSEHKKTIETYFLQEGDFGGSRTFNQAKIFK